MNVSDYFYLNPFTQVGVRELAGIIDQSPASVLRKLRKLNDQKLIKLENGKYIANFYNNHYKQKKIVRNIDKLFESKIVDKLVKELNPKAIILFGSYLRGNDIENSDIDIVLIGSEEKSINLKKYERFLNRPISLQFYQNLSKYLKKSLFNGFVLYGIVDTEI